jgi:hypothetical protein
VRTALLATLVLALGAALAPGAGAHGVGASHGYVSTLSRLDPPNLGVFVEIVQGDDRLRLTNTTGEELVVLGYEGEPYLRFGSDGVYRNARSPATYLNEDRFAKAPVPPDADPKAAPEWVRVSSGRHYEWHDHRIHWMSTIPPRSIQDAPGKRHHVFDWTVPAQLAGRPLAIHGSLDYMPPEASGFNALWVIPPAIAVLAVLGAWIALRRGPAARRRT